jgi:alkylation response protein AidB-like acyl-CoA dehydrogenase/N-acetylglutamate synthase-like GNAT family acetyltransferase
VAVSIPELRARFREVGLREVSARAPEHDGAAKFDREAFRRVGASGLLKLHVKKEYGGDGLGLREWAAAIEGFGEGSGDLGFSVSMVAHAGCAITVLQEFGTPEQCRRWLPGLMSGEVLAGVANSEPRGGTDVMGLRARARQTPKGFVLSARKRSITNAGEGDLLLTSARVEGASAREAVNIFLVPGAHPRVKQRPLRDLMGLRTSPTGDLLAWRAELPADALLGPLGSGVACFRRMFSLERLFIGYLFLGAIRRCLHRAVHHAETRLSFGVALGKNQYVQEKVVRMRVAEELLSAQLERTLTALLAGEDVFGALSIIKAYGADAARAAAEDLIALLGSQGMRASERAQKDFRDLMGLSILGGTQELQKIVIYRETVRALSVAPAARAEAGLTLEVKTLAEVDRALQAELVALTERTFPDVPALKGHYYYDTVPDSVVVARRGGNVVGLRIITRRTVHLGERTLKLAGLGIAVDPAHQRQGIGRALTRATLELLRSLGDELAVAFLLSPNARSLLTSFGFQPLEAEVTYTSRATNERVVEKMPCFVAELGEPDSVLPELRRRGKLHLGLGTW